MAASSPSVCAPEIGLPAAAEPILTPVPQAPRGHAKPSESHGLTLSDRIRLRWRSEIVDPFDARFGGAIRRRLNARREYQPLFIAGGMGCGTTLLALSLWQRFHVAAAIRESAHQVAPESFLHSRATDFTAVEDYEKSLPARPWWTEDQGRADLMRLYRSYARGSSDLVIDKGPNVNLVRAGFLARCFPEARFLLLFRDPVAAVEGFRRKWAAFRDSDLDSSIRFYGFIYESFLDQMWDFTDRVLAIEYEKLSEKHEDTMLTLGALLGLRPAKHRRRVEHRPNSPGCGIRNVSRGRIAVVRDTNRAAYEALSKSEVEKIKLELGPLHRRLQLMSI